MRDPISLAFLLAPPFLFTRKEKVEYKQNQLQSSLAADAAVEFFGVAASGEEERKAEAAEGEAEAEVRQGGELGVARAGGEEDEQSAEERGDVCSGAGGIRAIRQVCIFFAFDGFGKRNVSGHVILPFADGGFSFTRTG